MKGEIACLLHRGSTQTLECAIGLYGSDGKYYALRNLNQYDIVSGIINTGDTVEVSGIFTSGDVGVYAIAGAIDVSFIGMNGQSSGNGYIEPEDPEKTGLAPYPDLPLPEKFSTPFSIKFVVEHRSVLNDQQISVQGIIVGTLLGNAACPPDRGMCAQPRVFIADTNDSKRNPYYDLMVLVSEDEKGYKINDVVEIKGLVTASKTSLYMHKSY